MTLQQPVQPLAQGCPRQARVGLRLLNGTEADGQPQHWVQAVEALLHVGVSGWSRVKTLGVA